MNTENEVFHNKKNYFEDNINENRTFLYLDVNGKKFVCNRPIENPVDRTYIFTIPENQGLVKAFGTGFPKWDSQHSDTKYLRYAQWTCNDPEKEWNRSSVCKELTRDFGKLNCPLCLWIPKYPIIKKEENKEEEKQKYGEEIPIYDFGHTIHYMFNKKSIIRYNDLRFLYTDWKQLAVYRQSTEDIRPRSYVIFQYMSEGHNRGTHYLNPTKIIVHTNSGFRNIMKNYFSTSLIK